MDKDRAREMFEDGATIMWELAKLLRVGARILTAVAKELAYEWSNGHDLPPQPRSQRSGGQVPHQRETQQERAERFQGPPPSWAKEWDNPDDAVYDEYAEEYDPPVKWDPEGDERDWPPLQAEEDQTHLLDEEDDREW